MEETNLTALVMVSFPELSNRHKNDLRELHPAMQIVHDLKSSDTPFVPVGLALDLCLGYWAATRQVALVRKENVIWLTPSKYFPTTRKSTTKRGPSKKLKTIMKFLEGMDPAEVSEIFKATSPISVEPAVAPGDYNNDKSDDIPY